MRWVLLRGLVREKEHWGRFLPNLQAAFPQDQILCLEIPGNGECYLEKSPSSVPDLVEELRKKLPSSQEPTLIFAMSLGAMIASKWLELYPKDFVAAILLNGSIKGYSPITKRLRWQLYPRILRMLLTSNNAYTERNIVKMVSNLHGDDEEIVQAWIKIQKLRPVSRTNAVRQLIAAFTFTAPPRRPTDAPILLLSSAKDGLVHPDCSVDIEKRWKVDHLIHPEAGHDLTLDDASWVIEQSRNWLQKNFER